MFGIVVLDKAVVIWKNVFDKWNQGLPQNGNEQWGIHFAFSDGQSRPATITDACPDVHLHRLRLGFIAWLAFSFVAAWCACEFPSAQLSHP